MTPKQTNLNCAQRHRKYDNLIIDSIYSPCIPINCLPLLYFYGNL